MSTSREEPVDQDERTTPSPGMTAIAPGILLLAVGMTAVPEGPGILAWLLVAGGFALLLVGSIAKGVEWALALRDAGR